MFQRIRGAIDARIAEEQARQRASQETLSRSNSAARKSNNASPSQRTSRIKQDSSGIPSRGPDPAEFDGEAITGDDEPMAETSSSNQSSEKGGFGNPGQQSGQQAKGDAKEASTAGLKDGSVNELPTDIRVRLRRLDKLEARYQELLKAYRAAHARVLTIEPFETALRENTPLTSITDPRALTEYLNQISLKGDMVVEELKRVSSERDEFKAKVEATEKSAKDAWDEVSKLKSKNDSAGGSQVEDKDATQASPISPPGETSENPKKSPTPSVTSMATAIPGLSIFSPKTKAVSSPPPVEETEEFFSFDNEIPRLESEIKSRDKEITALKSQIKTLTNDLAVARESTEGMVHSLESATRELSGLREHKDLQEAKLVSQESSFKEQIAALESKLASASSELDNSTAEIGKLRSQIKETEEEMSRIKADLNAQEQSKANDKDASKRLEILQGVVTNLKSQLKEAEDTMSSLKVELSAKTAETDSLSAVVSFIDKGLDDNEMWKSARDRISHGEYVDFAEIKRSIKGTDPSKPTEDVNIPAATNATPAAATSGSKKKNKKKKKGTKQESDEIVEVSNANIPPQNSGTISDLELKIQKLETEIAEKDAAIDRLCLKLKGEENLREEIETLQDEVVSLGQDHVEAKDKVKELLAEKSALEKRAAEFEKEISSLRLSSTQSSDAEKAHKGLSVEFEDLKSKALILETDLNAAQQLAASRFKDLSDLRDTLQKLQPELRSLRAESAELKKAKEELKTKTSQVSDLEHKHDDLRSEIKSLQSSIEKKDSEVKTLRQKISQETNGRLKAEQALEVAQGDLRYSEGKKQEAIEANEKTLRDLTKTEEELRASQSRLRDVEEQVSQLNRDIEQLRDDIKLKTAQYSSAQSLMSSMRDQASEMAMQVKETTERCESLEEEVADAHRLLSERSREGETMRRMLSDIEMKADIKVREHKERLEAVIEERDRAEDEANSVNRRRAREIEELRTKARDAEKALRRIEEDKDEVEHAQREWKRRRGELESQLERSNQELAEVKEAMSHLRDALDESERHARDLEKEKAALRRSIEETNQRLEKLKRTNKSLASDLKASQLPNKRGIDSGNRSPRSSLESARQRGVTSPPPGTGSGRNGSITRNDTPTPIDYVYLKNVLLQFLEQKDRNHQKQLIPVLGMLLHFDPTDEQKWMSAISSR